MSKINTDDMRKALEGLDTCRMAWGLLHKDGGPYGPWGPSKPNGAPTVKPTFNYLGVDLPDSMKDLDIRGREYAKRSLERALEDAMPGIIGAAREQARKAIEVYETQVEALAQGKRI